MSRRGEGRKAWFFAEAKNAPSSFKNHSKLNTIREELEAFIETLRSEVGNKNGANLGPVYEYSSLQDEIIDLADEYSRAIEMGNEPLARSINQRQKEVGIRRKALKAQYPLVTLIKKTKTSAAVNKEINKLYKNIKKAQDNVETQLEKNKYPIWELNPVISDLFANVEFYQDASKQKYILEWISEQERIDQLFDAFKNAIPIALSIMCFFMPGGIYLDTEGRRQLIEANVKGISFKEE